MGLINLSDIENGNEATAELWNSRYAVIVAVINGNLNTDNIAVNGVATANIAPLAVTTGKINEGAATIDKWRNSVAFAAYHDTTQNSGNNAYADIAFNTELYDIGSNFASSTFTAPVDGIYHFDVSVRATANHTRLSVAVCLSDNTILMEGGVASSSNVTNDNAVIGGDVKLDESQTVKVRVFANATTALSGDANLVRFSGHLVTKVDE